ncbi:MAG: hypothetical protein E7342_01945 [Clostridiales bacterium]|nr:hypothetical protein [Clostridiales bacterium]
MEIIDAHTHIYPTKIALKAVQAIGDFYNIDMDLNGTSENLINQEDGDKISYFLVHSVATTMHQVHVINEFLLEELKKHPNFIGFCTLHPDLTEEEIEKEVKWATLNGFLGVKLHPDFQKFYLDEERAERIYRVLEKYNLPLLLHMGDKRYQFSEPIRLSKMAKKYTKLNFIAAHFGGYSVWDKVDVLKDLNNVYFDTSSSLEYLDKERAKELIKTFGAHRFFYGSDYPMWNEKEELKRFFSIDLTKEEQEMILAKNLKKFLNIK